MCPIFGVEKIVDLLLWMEHVVAESQQRHKNTGNSHISAQMKVGMEKVDEKLENAMSALSTEVQQEKRQSKFLDDYSERPVPAQEQLAGTRNSKLSAAESKRESSGVDGTKGVSTSSSFGYSIETLPLSTPYAYPKHIIRFNASSDM